MKCRADASRSRRLPGTGLPLPDALPLTEWQPDMPAATLSTMLFDGHCVVIRRLASVAAIVARATAIVEEIFGRSDPELAERDLASADFEATAFRARRAVLTDARLGQLWHETLEALGYAGATCYSDRLRLRVVPSEGVCSAPTLKNLPPHRDNWASGIAQQINWWMPLYALAPDRTMIVWPDLFRDGVENDSASWDPAELVSSGKDTHPLLPTAVHDPPTSGCPVMIEPGALLAFSGAQLHASRNEARGRSRLSLDTRTVWTDDVAAGRGAPDVDGTARRAHWEWFGNRNDPEGAQLAALADASRGETL